MVGAIEDGAASSDLADIVRRVEGNLVAVGSITTNLEFTRRHYRFLRCSVLFHGTVFGPLLGRRPGWGADEGLRVPSRLPPRGIRRLRRQLSDDSRAGRAWWIDNRPTTGMLLVAVGRLRSALVAETEAQIAGLRALPLCCLSQG